MSPESARLYREDILDLLEPVDNREKFFCSNLDLSGDSVVKARPLPESGGSVPPPGVLGVWPTLTALGIGGADPLLGGLAFLVSDLLSVSLAVVGVPGVVSLPLFRLMLLMLLLILLPVL